MTEVFKNTESELIKKAIEKDGIVLALKLKGFSGLLGYEPYKDIRLGKEMAELVRFYGLGGVFHSDELLATG